MRFKIYYIEIFVINAFILSCGSDDVSWSSVGCGKDFLAVRRGTNLFQNMIIDLIDQPLFGPALYFREDFTKCEWKFAIPLPFSVSSMTFNNKYFHFIRDDTSLVGNSWYQISQHDLVGGFLYWLELAEEQKLTCNDSIRLPEFSPENQWDLRNNTRFVVNKSICELDLDISYAQKRIDIPLASVKAFGLAAFTNLYNDFETDWSANDVKDKANAWRTWSKVSTFINSTMTVKSTDWSNYLLVKNANFHVFNSDSGQYIGQYLSATPVYYSEVFYYVLLKFNGEIVLKRGDFEVKIGVLPQPMKDISIIGNYLLVGIDFQNKLHVSDNYLTDVVYPLVECTDTVAYKTPGICFYNTQLSLPFTTLDADVKCGETNSTYVTTEPKTYRLATSSIYDDDSWHAYNGQEHFFSSDLKNQLNSKYECSKRQSKLATPKSQEIVDFFTSLGVNYQGGYIGLESISDFEFQWNDGTDFVPSDLSWKISAPATGDSCVHFQDSELNNIDCGDQSTYICQRNALLFTDDNWLKSLHTSYEYSMQGLFADFDGHESNCQSLNGHLAYTGIFEDDSYNYILDQYELNFNFYLGLKHIGSHEFVGLDMKPRTPHHFSNGEPNVLVGEDCVVFYKNFQAWIDIACSSNFNGLCQRLEEQCDLAVESRIQCHPDVPFTASRSECVKHDCCYLEPIDGDFICFKKIKNETAFAPQEWFTIGGSDYEYSIVDVGQIGMIGSRFKCRQYGGDLAYEDLTYEVNFKEIFQEIKNRSNDNQLMWIGFTQDSNQPISIEGDQSWTAFYNGNCGDCTVLEPRFGQWLSTPCESDISKTKALCQRLIGIDDVSLGLIDETAEIECNVPVDYCAKYSSSQCQTNSHCIDQGTYFQCICNDGYIEKFGVCEPLSICTDGWVHSNGKCFLVQSNIALSFFESELECIGVGGHLMTINSDDDLNILQGDLQTSEQVWLGHRRTIASGECVGLGSTDCEYIQTKQIDEETDFISECLKFNQLTSKFTWAPCHLSMKKAVGTTSAYICQYTPQKDYFSVHIMALSYDVYPGWKTMKINGGDITADLQDESITNGHTLLATFDKFGNVLYKKFVEANGNEIEFDNFMNSEINKQSALYFGIIHDHTVLPEAWAIFTETMNEKISDFPVDSSTYTVELRTVQDSEFHSSILDQDEVLLKCGDCISGCLGTEIYLTSENDTGCRVYTFNSPTFEYEIYVLKWDDDIFEKDVIFRSQIIKEIGSFNLSCPRSTIDILGMGVNQNDLSTTNDNSVYQSNIDCQFPPCVHQIACVKQGSIITQDLGVGTRILFCHKNVVTKSWNCPINKHNGPSQGILEEQFDIPIDRKEPFLATFDDLLHLGSPAIEFYTTLQYPLWSPALWHWKNFNYAALVQGIKGYALRFGEQEVTTKLDFCLSCVPGITLSFWFKVLQPTSQDRKIILITGKTMTDDDNLDELGVFINENQESLTVFVRNNENIWISNNILFQLQKWTFLIVEWNLSGLQISIDSITRDTTTTYQTYSPSSFSNIASIVANRIFSSMSIGSNYSSTSNIFDMDQLTLYYKKFNFLELQSELGSVFPLRHRFYDKKSSYYLNEQPQINSLYHPANLNYVSSCVGSISNCKQGFTIGFTLKIDSDAALDKVDSNDHILLISNTPFTNMLEEKAKASKARGFSVQISDISEGVAKIEFKQTLSDDFTYKDHLEWEFEIDETISFWAQIDIDGAVFFCKRWPSNCKQIKTEIPIIDTLNEVATHTTLNIGPYYLRYDSNNAVSESITDVFMYNVWFLEQSLDLLIFADEIQQLNSPIYFQVSQPMLFTTRNGIAFENKGPEERASKLQDYGQIFFFLYNHVGVIADPERVKEYATYLEMSPENFNSSMPCLYDLENCVDGFTIQFTVLTHACHTQISGTYCYLISTGGKFSSISQGLNIYFKNDHKNIHIDLATRTRKWHIHAKSNSFLNVMGVYRISWSPSAGLSLMINDIVVARVMKWQSVTRISNYEPYTTFTLGKLSSASTGYYTFKMADLYYWEGVVESFQLSNIRECPIGWYQIGENCFLQEIKQVEDENYFEYCSDNLGYPPSFTSYAAYHSISQHLLGSTYRFYNGLTLNGEFYWVSNELPISMTSFNIEESTAGVVEVRWNEVDYYRNELKWERRYRGTNSAMCMTSIFKVNYFEGCYAFNNEFDTHEIRVHDKIDALDDSYFNALGTYTSSQACRKACRETNLSQFILMIAQKCHCADESVQGNEISSLSKLSTTDCADYSNIVSDSVSSYSYLNYPTQSRDSFQYKLTDFCGAMEDGGLYKCGKKADTTKASLFITHHSPIDEIVVHHPLTDFAYELLSEVKLELYVNFGFKITSLSCCVDDDCICNDIIHFEVDFKDGTIYENQLDYDSLLNKEFEHFYETSGAFEVKIRLFSSGDWLEESFTVTVYGVLTPVIIKQVLVNPIEPGNLATITAIAISGNSFKCVFNYGDYTPTETLYRLRNSFIPITYHKYENAGYYDITVTCDNRLSLVSYSTYVAVQTAVTDIDLVPEFVIGYGDDFVLNWKLATGSHALCNVHFTNSSLTEIQDNSNSYDGAFSFDNLANTGIANISSSLYLSNHSCLSTSDAIVYTSVVSCYNALTNPSSYAVTYSKLEVPIKSFTANIKENKKYFKKSEEFCIDAGVEEGSNLIMVWDVANNEEKSMVEYCGEDECYERQLCASFDEPGVYTTTIHVFNALGNETISLSVVYEIEISDLRLTVDPSILPQFPTLFKLLHLPDYPEGLVDIDFGDGEITQIVLGNFNEETHQILFSHRYSAIGYYTAKLNAYNNVSSFDITQTFQVGINIGDVSFSMLSTRFLRTKLDDLVLQIEVKEGSELRYYLNFGAGNNPSYSSFSENITRTSPIFPDFHKVFHKYQVPGNFTVSLRVSNIFGEFSTILSEKIVVQNPLTHGEFDLVGSNLAEIAFPPGVAEFSADLQPTLQSGYANNVHALWSYYSSEGAGVLLEVYKDYEIEHFPVSFTFQYESIGIIFVQCDLWNIVSNLTLFYQFDFIEIAGDIVLDMDHLEASFSNVMNGHAVNASIQDTITFKISLTSGSHIVYNLDFGDNETMSKSSPVLLANQFFVEFQHAYSMSGIFTLTIEAYNAVSNKTFVFDGLVQIYDPVSDLETLISYIDIDKERTGINVFDQSSELYSLVYGTPAVKRDSTIYLPLNRLILLKSSSLLGSNVSVDWNFVGMDVNVHIDEFDNVYDDDGVIIENKIIESDDFKLKVFEKLTYEDLLFIGESARNNYDANQYSKQSSVLLQYTTPGVQTVEAIMGNAISQKNAQFNYEVLAEVGSISFPFVEPPIANKTSNISFVLSQVGTTSCYIVNVGDGSKLITFGSSFSYCLKHPQINSDNFHLLEGMTDEGSMFSFTASGDLISGTAMMYVSILHQYIYTGLVKVEVSGFNDISRTSAFLNLAITEILCDYPVVNLEKNEGNDIDNPRKVFSFLQFRIYSSINTFCKLTSVTEISWVAYSLFPKSTIILNTDISTEDEGQYTTLPLTLEEFQSTFYNYKLISGLKFTSNSEDIAIRPRFLELGLHLICINVAMYQVPGVNSSDCIFIHITLPPLVAGIQYGIRRAVGANKVIDMNAAVASFDPDKETLEDVASSSGIASNLTFIWSCPILVDKSFNESSEEAAIMFEPIPDLRSDIFCESKKLSCFNSLRGLIVHEVLFTNLTANTNATILRQLLSNVLSICQGQNSCNISVLELTENLFNYTNDYCLNVTYHCDIVGEYFYKYVASNTSCLTSGYYPSQTYIGCEVLNTTVTSNCGKIQVNTSSLGYNSMYLMRVKVYDAATERFSLTSQVFEIADGGPPILRITCILNCNLKVNPRTAIAFNVQQTNEIGETISSNTSMITYTWSLLQSRFITSFNGSVYEQFVVVNNFTNLTATGINRPSVVIKPYALEPGFKYHVGVEGKVPNFSNGLSEVEIKTNLPPYGGECDVEPKTGIALTTRFTITCMDWKDEGVKIDRNVEISPRDYTLSYQVLYTCMPNSQLRLLSYGNNAVMSGRYLPPGLEEYDFRLWLQVRIIDEFGEWAVSNLNITVHEATEVMEADTLTNLTLSEISTSGSQDIAQFSATISGVLNQAVASNESEAAMVNEARTNIRSQLLGTVVEKINGDSDLDGIQQSCSAIGSLTEVSTEVDEASQLNAVGALTERTELLSRLSESRSSEDVLETAAVVAVGIDNVVKATRSQVVRNGEMSSEDVVAVPVFSPPVYIERSPNIPLDVEEEFLSPEERVMKRKEEQKKKEENFRKNQQLAMNVGSNALNSVSSLSKSVLMKKQPDEPSVMVKTNGLTMESEKNSMADFCNRINSTMERDRVNGTSNSLRSLLSGSNVTLPGCDNSTASDESIESELLTLADNPYIWDESADSVRSSVVSLTFSFPNGTKPFNQSSDSLFRLEIPVDPSFNGISAESYSFTPSGDDKMSFHEFNIRKPDDTIFLKIQPLDSDVMIRTYFLYTDSLKQYPTTENYTFTQDLPVNENAPGNEYRMRLEGRDLEVGRYVFGILQINEFGNITSDENRTLTNYTIFNFVTSCQFWNETTNKWETTGCRVSDETTNKIVVCMCNHLTSFGADFLVAPNPIDFSTIGAKLANLKDNLAVLLTLIGIFVLYIVGVFFCRRQDKKDVAKWAVGLLDDNKLSDRYFYQLIVTTGGHRNAETASSIYFNIFGENGRTGLRMLRTNGKETRFKRSSVRKFLMTSDISLGKLTDIKIWHDNSGKGNLCSWYLQHITVVDLQSKNRFFFFCDDWFAVDQSDGRIERLLPVADETQIKSFKHLFSSSTKKNFSNGHLWFSLISRPTKSNFTRVQRLSCGLAILFSTMLTSAMFFGKDDEDQGNDGRLEIGPISFTVQQLIISIQASLIVIPINILLVEMFRRILPKNTQKVDGSFASLNGSVIDGRQTESEIELQEKKKNDSKFMLPHWMVYVTWILVFLVCSVSFTFVFLYSVEWGAEKANDWLLTIILSFIQSVFIVQPAKVVLVSIVVSFAVHKFFSHKASEMLDQDEEEHSHEREEDMEEFKKNEEEWLMKAPLDDNFELMDSHSGLPSSDELTEARIAREQHRLMIDAIYDIASYLFYVILLLIAANSSKDINAFNFHDSLANVFLREGDPVLEEVRTVEDLWGWCDETLIPGLHASNWYNGDRITWQHTRFISNRETFVTGPARLRQLRVKKGDCVVTTNTSLITRDCVEEYSILNQEVDDFGPGWSTNSSDNSTYWTFQNFIDLGGYPYQGKTNLYDGGGYPVTLSSTANKSKAILNDINRLNWIDRQTAAVFIEFSVYNANINLFASVVLLLERSQNGAFFAYPVISPIRLYDFIDGTGYVLIVIYICFLIVLLYKMYFMIKLIKLQRKRFLHSFWNVIDFVGVLLALSAIGLYAVRTIYANYVLNKMKEDYHKETFVNFQYLALWNDTFRYVLSFTLFLATLKFTKLLRFNRRIRLLACTLKHAAKPIGSFSVMFSIYFVAFMFLSNLWFEQKMYEYSSQYLAIEEMFSMLLGRFDFTEMQNSDPLLGPIFFCMFTGICTIALLNMFIVILDDSIKKARAEMEKQINEFEVMDYLSKQILNYFSSLAPKLHQDVVIEDTAREKITVDLLEERVNSLTNFVTKMELQYYNSFSISELEQELDELDDNN